MRTEDGGATLVTLDGPAGSGKSTTAQEVARRLGYRYLDSGALYRALTWALMEQGVDPDRWEALTEEDLTALGIRAVPGEGGLRLEMGTRVLGDEIRSEPVTERVSRLAALPAVRDWLLGIQRSAGRAGRLVADGRDMGTVVFPEARAKVFLDADVRERARRRLGDKGVDGPSGSEVDEEAERLAERDARDREREHSPLRVPDGALVVNTTALGFEEQVRLITDYARSVAEDAGAVTVPMVDDPAEGP